MQLCPFWILEPVTLLKVQLCVRALNAETCGPLFKPVRISGGLSWANWLPGDQIWVSLMLHNYSCLLSWSLSLCVPPRSHISVRIDQIPFWGLISCILTDNFDTSVPSGHLRVPSLCGCQDAAVGTELLLPHTPASRIDALCVFTIRYGFILASLTLFFLLFDHLSVFLCVCIHVAPCLKLSLITYLPLVTCDDVLSSSIE